VLLCGRYEGVDQRVVEARGMREISVGDYVLSGGETAAMVLLDACVRLLPGVMGAAESAVEESFAADGLLEYPHYTRPAEWNGLRVPEVLLSGHHADVAAGAAPRPSAPPASAGPTCGRAAPGDRNGRGGEGGRRRLPPAPTPPKPNARRTQPMNLLQQFEADQQARLLAARPVPEFDPATPCA
jgi:hypothetical protein